jgi:hypothetical protein
MLTLIGPHTGGNKMETNNLEELYGSYKNYHEVVTNTAKETVDWTDKRLAKIVRLRLLSDPGFPWWDTSYCHGQLKDGSYVNVAFPWFQLPKGKVNKTIVWWAKKEGVYAKGLGIFDVISKLQ